jgi:hypothetical protein
MAKTDKPMAAAEKPLRITFPPRGEITGAFGQGRPAHLPGILTEMLTARKQTE